MAVPTKITNAFTQACGSFWEKCALEYPPRMEPAVITIACGHTIVPVAMKAIVATPLITPPSITFSLFIA